MEDNFLKKTEEESEAKVGRAEKNKEDISKYDDILSDRPIQSVQKNSKKVDKQKLTNNKDKIHKVNKEDKVSKNKKSAIIHEESNPLIFLFKEFFNNVLLKIKELSSGLDHSYSDNEIKSRWQPLDVLETNLIKGEEVLHMNWRRNGMMLLGSILGAFLVVMVGYAFLLLAERGGRQAFFGISGEKEPIVLDIDKEITKAEKITSKGVKFADRLNLVGKIFENRVYWTGFFAFLEKNTLTDVDYGSFSGDSSGSYSFDVDAHGVGYQVIEQSIDQFQSSPYVKSVSVTEGSYGRSSEGSSLKFGINLELDKDVFINKEF